MGTIYGWYEELMTDYILTAHKWDKSVKEYSERELESMSAKELEDIINGLFLDNLNFKCFLAGVVESRFFAEYSDCNDVMNTVYYGVNKYRKLFGVSDKEGNKNEE